MCSFQSELEHEEEAIKALFQVTVCLLLDRRLQKTGNKLLQSLRLELSFPVENEVRVKCNIKGVVHK